MQNISICVSDIPKNRITTAKNGKKYLNITVDDRKAPDKYGNDVTVYLTQTKEERAAKVDKTYIGNGKKIVFNSNTQPQQSAKNEQMPLPESDDMPF